ncbi:MAG TPA: hypothetical protein VFX98_09185 [Longimicrobiaceae bacterium]|nr:hypothetical protein [Longimicrobiaceae bacterium]
MSVRRSLGAVALAVAVAACAANGTSPGSGAAPVAFSKGGVRQAVVEVENFNWQDVTIYAVHLNSRIRLGMVTSMSKQCLRLPERFVASGTDFRLLADPVGGGAPFVSENIRVRDGQAVAFSVQNLLTLSSVAIWDR